ncbi:hypothetical protein [Aliarcobacter butzleri]|uniref:Uncharacterized protein n=1 Tax=Aliarcobacter butzleri TaxID=28197 RepID=A0AAW7PQL1_9BACT|nr:hypothetical protein [Aliarcobacter butzleri]MDN5063328.1 hypothetical protein [Aliarcobacter butzleri]MDN5065876.1 hypothetical protein [Aliarcobacter butzleri]
MSDTQKIEELEKKVLELEKLKDNCTLTNDIKVSLTKYIKSNEEIKEEVEKIINENKIKQDIHKKSWLEYIIRTTPILLYILLTWCIIISIADKIIEYKKIDIPLTKEVKVAQDAK